MQKASFYLPEIIGSIVGIFLVNAPLLFSDAYRGDILDPSKAGLFGDFVGGYIGSLILVISVAFISASYRNQKTTNIRAAFESRFLHKSSVDRMRFDPRGRNDDSSRVGAPPARSTAAGPAL